MPASSRTFRWWASRFEGNPSSARSSPGDASPAPSRSTMRRRAGSAKADKPATRPSKSIAQPFAQQLLSQSWLTDHMSASPVASRPTPPSPLLSTTAAAARRARRSRRSGADLRLLSSSLAADRVPVAVPPVVTTGLAGLGRLAGLVDLRAEGVPRGCEVVDAVAGSGRELGEALDRTTGHRPLCGALVGLGPLRCQTLGVERRHPGEHGDQVVA